MRYHALGFRKALKLLLAWLWSTLLQRHVRRPCSNIDKQGKLICSNIYISGSGLRIMSSRLHRCSKMDVRNLIRNAALTLSASGSTSSRPFDRLALYLRLQYRLRFEVVCGCINLQPRQVLEGCWSQSLLNDFEARYKWYKQIKTYKSCLLGIPGVKMWQWNAKRSKSNKRHGVLDLKVWGVSEVR